MTNLNIVLFAPEIPGNTGTIGRTCVALNLRLILIRPLGFDIDEKAVRRAGLDYWKHLNLTIYNNWDDFLENESPKTSSLLFFSKRAHKVHYHGNYAQDCYLIFGSETQGLPEHLFIEYPDNFLGLPLYSKKVRSINLSNATTAVIFEGIRQLDFNSI